jgi:hypothetical protein
MKKILILAFFISFIVFLMSLSVFYYSFYPVKMSSFFANAAVTQNTAGFDVNSSALTFGSVAIGGTSTRSISINNSYPFPVKVKVKAQGTISDKISYTPLIIEPNKVESLKITFSSNSSLDIGNYEGNISFILYRA